MGAAGRLEQDGVKFVTTVLAIIAVIVLVQNSGGINTILSTLFGGFNSTVGQLLDARQPRSA